MKSRYLQAASGALVNAVAVREHREAPYLGREIRWWLRGIQSAPAWDALTPDLLALLVRYRVWSSQQAVAFLVQKPLYEQSIYVRAVAPYLEPEDWLPILASLNGAPEEDRARFLAELGHVFPEGLLEKALHLARALASDTHRAWAYAGLLPAWALQGYAREALEEACSLASPQERAYVIATLLPTLPSSWLGEVATLALSFTEDGLRALILENAAPHLMQTVNENLLEAVYRISSPYHQARVWLAWLAYAPPEHRFAWVEQVLARIASIEVPTLRGLLLLQLRSYLAPPYLQQALALAEEIPAAEGRVDVLLALLARARGRLRTRLRRMIQETIEDLEGACVRAVALARMYPYLPRAEQRMTRQALLQIARGLSPDQRIRVLAELFPHFPSRLQRRLFQEMKDTLRTLTFRRAHAWGFLLAALARAGWHGPLFEALLQLARESPANYPLRLAEGVDLLPPQAWLAFLPRVWNLDDPVARRETARIVLPRLRALPRALLYDLWRQLRKVRTELTLSDVAALLPLVEALGGESALAELARALGDILPPPDPRPLPSADG